MKNVANKRNYSSNSLTTTWDPLPTLDLTDIDPDIVYTFELVEITCGQNVSISSNIMAEIISTVENLDMMQIYKAIIAARNNVREGRNGPSVEISGKHSSIKFWDIDSVY